MITEIKKFRDKYPQYNDLDDAALATKLAQKYPGIYDDLPGKVKEEASKPRTWKEYIAPSWATKYQEKPGERTLLGDIWERPLKAGVGAVRGGATSLAEGKGYLSGAKEGYMEGALRPESVEPQQEKWISDFYKNRPIPTTLKGKIGEDIAATGVSAMGLVSDIAMNPADLLTLLSPKTPVGKGKTLGGVISKTKLAKSVGRFMTKERSFAKIGKSTKEIEALQGTLSTKRPRIITEKWREYEAARGQKVTKGVKDALGNAYDTVYSTPAGADKTPIRNIHVDPSSIDDILLKSNVDDIVLKEIDTLIGGKIDTVEKAKLVSDILRKRTPQALYQGGGKIGKGGITSSKIRQVSAARAVKDVIYDSISSVDKEAAAQLIQLDEFASNRVYPKLDKMYSIYGRKKIPSTEGMVSTYGTGKDMGLGKSAGRQVLRKTPKTIKELGEYTSPEYQKELDELLKNSKQLVAGMNQWVRRRWIKYGTGAAALSSYFLRRKLYENMPEVEFIPEVHE